MAALYSKIERRVWRDEKVRRLSKAPPNARDLWLYLLSCDSQGAFPGLYVLRLAVAADDLEWSVDDTRRMLDEIVQSGMARYDAATSVLWLPNAVHKRADEALSKHTAKGWRNAWNELPACDLTRLAWQAAIEAIRIAGEESEPKVVEEALRAFSSRPPAWLDRGAERVPAGSSEAPSKPPAGPLDAPSSQKEQEKRDQQEEGDARGRAREPTPTPTLTERGAFIAKAIAEHADLFGRLTTSELAPYALRIDRELAKLETRDVWADLEAEIAGWVSHARGKREEKGGWSDARTLNEVESFARIRIRERPVRAREERDRRPTGPRPGHGAPPVDFDAQNAVREAEELDARYARPRERVARGGDPSSLAASLPRVAAGGDR